MIVKEMLRVELLWLQPQLRILVALNKYTEIKPHSRTEEQKTEVVIFKFLFKKEEYKPKGKY